MFCLLFSVMCALCGFPEYIYVLFIEKNQPLNLHRISVALRWSESSLLIVQTQRNTSVSETLYDKKIFKAFFLHFETLFNNNEKL